ncbi:MAG: hypothetical protein MJE77_07795 [Proteobacteria bacterium]|nr:hypothetical protein [Pseudomonadota bacterium]
MQSVKRILIYTALLSLLTPALARAQKRDRIALLPVSGTNVHEGYLQATQDFLRAHLESTGTFEVALIAGANSTREIMSYEAVGRAREIGAIVAVVVHVSRLGSTARVRLAAYDVKTAYMVHVDEMAAESPEDLDKVLKRLAIGLATGKKAHQVAEIDTVTQKEADALLKQKATNVVGMKIGAVTPVSRAGEGETALPGLGLFWLYDARSFLADISVDFHYKSGDGDISIGLGAYYPFNKSNTTPYLGLAVRYGRAGYTAGSESRGGTGVSVHATFGVLIGRLSTVQLRGETSFFVNTFDEEDSFGMKSRANGVVVSAGIGF